MVCVRERRRRKIRQKREREKRKKKRQSVNIFSHVCMTLFLSQCQLKVSQWAGVESKYSAHVDVVVIPMKKCVLVVSVIADGIYFM